MSFFHILIALLVLDLCWWWLTDGLLRRANAHRGWRVLIACWSVLMIVNIFIWMLPAYTSSRIQAHIPEWIIGAVYIWHLLAVPVSCVGMLLSGNSAHALRDVSKLRRSTVPQAQVPSTPDAPSEPTPTNDLKLTRREMIGLSAASVGPLILTAGTGKAVLDIQQYNVEHKTIAIADLPREFDGLTIAHLSDLHNGRFTGGAFLERISETIAMMDADFMLFTGDLIDRNLRDLPSAIAMCRKLRAKQGVAYCLGNHDLIDSRVEFISQMRRANLPLLINASMDFNIRGKTLRIMGLDWERSHDGIPESSEKYLAKHDPSVFTIALAHHPHAFDLTAGAGIPLTLSGHTHGGQIMFTPETGIGSLAFRYWSGLYRRNNTAMIVSNGVGNWFPVRVNAPAEISKLTLKRA